AIEFGGLAGIGPGRGHRDGGAGGDHGRIVARNVRNDEGRYTRRGGDGGEATALHGAQLVADQVHHSDRGARGEKLLVDRLLVLKAEAGGGLRQEGGAATRDQRDHEVVVAEAGELFEHAAG